MEYAGLRWYKCDFHLHTMTSPCYKNKSDSIELWLDEVESKGLNCIAVTDHNDFRNIDEIVEKAKAREITVFPGVEITCDSSKIHILVLFDINKIAADVRDFLASIGIKRDSVEQGTGTLMSVFEVCKKAKESGCIVIPAHIDEYNGISTLYDVAIKNLFETKYIDAFQVVNQDIWQLSKEEQLHNINKKYGVDKIDDATMQSWRKIFNKANETSFPMIMSSDNPSGLHESEHGLWGIGRTYTWIKMGTAPNLESLRQAFLAAEERVKTCIESENEPERVPQLWVKSIEIKDTVISPHKEIKTNFNPKLNSIIGGRGSGKSSIIRTITGILKAGNFSDLKDIQEEQDSFYKVVDSKTGKGILKDNSVIEIELYRNGGLYKITESSFKKGNSDIKIQRYRQESEEWEDLSAEHLSLFEIEAYTQKQIYELAQAPDALSNLIDKDIEGLDKLKEKANECRTGCADKIREIREANGKISIENKLQLELKDINERIDEFKKSEITDAIALKQHKEDEQKLIEDYLQELRGIGNELIQWAANKSIDLPDEALPYEIRKQLENLKNNADTRIHTVKEIGQSIIKDCDVANEKIDASQWKKDFDNAQNKFAEAKEKLEEKNLQTDILDDLLESQRQKEEEIQKIAKLKVSIGNKNKEKEQLEEKYLTSLKDIRDCRKRFVNSVLDGKTDVKIEYLEHNSSKSVERMLLSFIQNPSATVVDEIKKIADDMVKKDGVKRFIKMISEIIKDEEVEGVNIYFKKAIKKLPMPLIDQMLSFVPEDDLKVSYKSSGGKFIPLVTASPGQKTTAILTFILAYGEKPLLLDQPEDDLDNRLVYDLVVKQLKESKKQRQIIVVTHNANIPVNGDAEYIISLDSANRYVKVKCTGTMDDKDIRDEICDVMEGSEFAFGMRAKKYHMNISN